MSPTAGSYYKVHKLPCQSDYIKPGLLLLPDRMKKKKTQETLPTSCSI